MIRTTIFAIALVLVVINIGRAQQRIDGTDVYVESWATGNKIREQVLTFDLDTTKHEQTAIVRDHGAGSFKLIFSHHPAGKEDYRLEYWVAQLKPILSAENRREKLGDNLLTSERPGPGGDNFPKEDWVAVLYPRENPKNISEKILEGNPYPISARRVIKIRNFYMFIKVNSFEMNEKSPKKLDSMNVTVEFSNCYLGGKNCK